MTAKRLLKYSLLLLPVLLWVALIVCNDLTHPHIGDDAMYGEYYPRHFRFFQSFYSMWMNCNARFFDITVRVWLHHCPRGLFALISGALTALLFASYSRLTGVTLRHPLLWSEAIGLLILCCPWGDDLQLFVVQLNYLWSLSINALVLVLIFRSPMNSPRWLWLLPLAGIAGCGHEIFGIPTLTGIGAWLLWRSDKTPLSLSKKWVLAFLIAGCLFSISSPASYRRFDDLTLGSHSDQAVWLTVLQSGYLAIVLIIDIAVLALRRLRQLEALCHTVWLPLVCISLCSLMFVIAGNVPGRAGWGVQFYALVALLKQYTLSGHSFRKSRPTTPLWLTISLFLSVQAGASIYWQTRVNGQIRDILTRYDASPDGQVEVYYDTAADMPLLLMGRVKPAEFEPGVGEGDWYAYALEQIYGKRISIRRRSGA